MKDVVKSHLLIADRFLAALLYFKDKDDRGCLKLSFKNKLKDYIRGTDMPTSLPVPAKLANPIGIDISYKFKDRLLEVKRSVGQGIFEREFYDTPLSVETCLFIIRIKDWRTLDMAAKPKSPLVLSPPNGAGSVAIVFSFLGSGGKPICPKELTCSMGVIDLPETILNKFCIGISSDSSNNWSEGFRLDIPCSNKKNLQATPCLPTGHDSYKIKA